MNDPHAPLKPDVFSILLALLEGDAHGYAIMRRASPRSARPLQAGALYRLLKRMLGDGLIEELDRRRVEPGRDERRRIYRITDEGRAVAAAEARRMAELVSVSRTHDLLDETR